jgi:NAD(P)-dependent dehydrogenase (short-subunit alcohol dehydrogenase family)
MMAGRVAVVTGGAGALGQAVTLRLLADGALVWVLDLSAPAREHLLSRVPAPGRERLRVVAGDATDLGAMQGLAQTVLDAHGRTDILVTTVGGFAGGALAETDRATWDRMLALNLTSAYAAARAFVPSMVAAGHGRVVTVASRAALVPARGFFAYSVSKAAVIASTRVLAEEVRGTGVTVNSVLPSTMDTPDNRAAMPDADRRDWVPVERVADAIAFLTREDSGHITGSLVAI